MKNYLSLSLTALCLFAAIAAGAQPRLPRIPKNLVKADQLLKQIKIPRIPNPLGKPALPPTIHQLAQLPPITRKVTAVPDYAPIRTAVLPLRETVSDLPGLADPFTASSFVIEEEFEGKKYLWGVTAAHIAHIMRGYPAFWMENYLPIDIEFSALGNAGMDDVALFPIPENMANHISPLKLAETRPAVGEKTYSFGFFNDDFYLVPNRKIQEVTPNRLITSLEFDTTNRGGACGGPILNAQGEVVGVHIGSSDSQHISFVVPADAIKRLLQAYRQGGKNLQQLQFNGLPVAQININESIYRIRTVTGGYITGDFLAYHQEKDIDYNHLEKIVQDTAPDKLQIFIVHKPFAWTGTDRHEFFFQITYNFATGKSTRQEIEFLPH